MNQLDWVFYSIYPGSQGYLDEVVTEIVAPLVEKWASGEGVHNWFFIRYIDEQGPHVRLRFQVEEDFVDFYEEALEKLIESKLETVLSRPPSEQKRLLPFLQGGQEPAGEVTFQLEEYEPEYEKYGGMKGVAIAERCFASSSRLAVTAMNAEKNRIIDRFHLALLTMEKTVDQAGLSAEEKNRLWEKILHYWSGTEFREDGKLKESLRIAAQKRGKWIQNHLEQYRQNQKVEELLSEYVQSLQETFRQVRETPQITLSPSHLAFHYIHMMNNRLGVWPLEEAYLGALLGVVEGEKI